MSNSGTCNSSKQPQLLQHLLVMGACAHACPHHSYCYLHFRLPGFTSLRLVIYQSGVECMQSSTPLAPPKEVVWVWLCPRERDGQLHCNQIVCNLCKCTLCKSSQWRSTRTQWNAYHGTAGGPISALPSSAITSHLTCRKTKQHRH